jgi:hypothetical protein
LEIIFLCGVWYTNGFIVSWYHHHLLFLIGQYFWNIWWCKQGD